MLPAKHEKVGIVGGSRDGAKVAVLSVEADAFFGGGDPAPRLNWVNASDGRGLRDLAADGAAKGPFPEAELRGMAQSGALTRASMVWSPGMEGWKAAGDVPELAALFAQVPPPLPPGA